MEKHVSFFLILAMLAPSGCTRGSEDIRITTTKDRGELSKQVEQKTNAIIEDNIEIPINVFITNTGITANMSDGTKKFNLNLDEDVEIYSISFMEYVDGSYSGKGWAIENNSLKNCHVRMPDEIEYGQTFPSCLTVIKNSRFNKYSKYAIDIYGAVGKHRWIKEFSPVIHDKRNLKEDSRVK